MYRGTITKRLSNLTNATELASGIQDVDLDSLVPEPPLLAKTAIIYRLILCLYVATAKANTVRHFYAYAYVCMYAHVYDHAAEISPQALFKTLLTHLKLRTMKITAPKR